MPSPDKSTETKIIDAARKVFQQRGFAGARMQDIADEAGINKALLHYYFRSKDKLFDMVIAEAVARIFPPIVEIWTSQAPLFEKLERFVHHYIKVLIENPFIPSFVIHEIAQNPERIKAIMQSPTPPPKAIILAQIEEAVAQGLIRPIPPHHLMMNLVSMCIMPFAGQNFFKGVMQVSDEQYIKLMQERPKIIIDFIKASLKPEMPQESVPEL
jgi:AcrR family transcriptional regulator